MLVLVQVVQFTLLLCLDRIEHCSGLASRNYLFEVC